MKTRFVKAKFPIRGLLLAALAVAPACGDELGDGTSAIDPTDRVEVAISTTATIPPDGQCTHIVATRLADFQVSEYKGPLAGAVLAARKGDNRVTATAYAPPCSAEPAPPPWKADDQIVTFAAGQNTLRLAFHPSVSVGIDPTFDQDGALLVREDTRVRTGRNGEDAAGPNYSLDGWEVKAISVPGASPPGLPGESTLFSTQGKGNLPYTPRGLAVTPAGEFVFQLAEVDAPLRVFSGAGDFLASWPVVAPAGMIHWDNTDGIDSVDATHLVRTGWLNTAIGCDAAGAHCVQAGLDLLERKTAADGSTYVEVVRQIPLPERPDLQLNREYPVGVTALSGGRFAVTTLPGEGNRLLVLDASGTFLGAVDVAGAGAEGLFVAADGRLGVLDYDGHLSMYDPAGLSPVPLAQASFSEGVDFSLPTALAWSDTAGQFVALSGTRVVLATPTFGALTALAIDLSAFVSPSGMDVKPDSNQIAVIDRIPPVDATTGTRQPVAALFDLASGARTGQVVLAGVPLPVRPRSLAYLTSRAQFVTHYRRPGGVADAALDAVAFLHHQDGSLAGTIDLTPFGFVRIDAVNYLRASDELLFLAVDATRVSRLVVCDASGHPRRSYRADALAGVVDFAQGSAGEIAAFIQQPSEIVRIVLP